MTLFERLYLPAIAIGLWTAFRHMFRRTFTIQYPEEKKELSPRFRGVHRLTKDASGDVKCVACYMCATACPAHCISIDAKDAPPGRTERLPDGTIVDRYKMPAKFEIDLLRCIYCGYCVEACPKDAIEMTDKIPPVFSNRKDYIYDIDKLLGTK